MKSEANLSKHIQIGQKGHLNVLEHQSQFQVSQIQDDEAAIDLSKIKINKQF